MRGDIWSSKEANNRWAYIKDNEKKLKTKNLKGISFINYISYNKCYKTHREIEISQ